MFFFFFCRDGLSVGDSFSPSFLLPLPFSLSFPSSFPLSLSDTHTPTRTHKHTHTYTEARKETRAMRQKKVFGGTDGVEFVPLNSGTTVSPHRGRTSHAHTVTYGRGRREWRRDSSDRLFLTGRDVYCRIWLCNGFINFVRWCNRAGLGVTLKMLNHFFFPFRLWVTFILFTVINHILVCLYFSAYYITLTFNSKMEFFLLSDTHH